MKRGQSATEFVLLVGFMILVFFIFFLIIQERIVTISKSQDLLYLKEATNVVKNEIELANAMGTDFTRTFSLESLGGKNYQITIYNESELVASYQEFQYVVFLQQNITGPLNGVGQENTLYHLDGDVLFPDGSITQYSASQGLFLNVNPETCYIADTLGRCADTNLLSSSQRTLCNSTFALC